MGCQQQRGHTARLHHLPFEWGRLRLPDVPVSRDFTTISFSAGSSPFLCFFTHLTHPGRLHSSEDHLRYSEEVGSANAEISHRQNRTSTPPLLHRLCPLLIIPIAFSQQRSWPAKSPKGVRTCRPLLRKTRRRRMLPSHPMPKLPLSEIFQKASSGDSFASRPILTHRRGP